MAGTFCFGRIGQRLTVKVRQKRSFRCLRRAFVRSGPFCRLAFVVPHSRKQGEPFCPERLRCAAGPRCTVKNVRGALLRPAGTVAFCRAPRRGGYALCPTEHLCFFCVPSENRCSAFQKTYKVKKGRLPKDRIFRGPSFLWFYRWTGLNIFSGKGGLSDV